MQEPAPSSTALPATQRSKTAPKKTARQQPVAKPAGKRAKTGKKAVSRAQPPKVKKIKLVRDSFTIPKDEYGALAELKQRCTQLDHPAKKSELLRAGIKALAGMSDRSLLAALKAVPPLKTGRPKKA